MNTSIDSAGLNVLSLDTSRYQNFKYALPDAPRETGRTKTR